MLKVASWNVNSLKIREQQVLSWLETTNTDILALQETKVIDSLFPETAFREKGYHLMFAGQPSYNGVAIISKYPITDVLMDIPDLVDPQRRILAATVAGMRIINVYVPNGSSLDSEKFVYKCDWLHKMTAFIKRELALHPKLMVLGDFNIAPEDQDVHDPVAWEGSVLVSPRERQALADMLQCGLVDSFRQFPQEERIYSWWDYRAAAFRRNMGLRIDLILLNQALQAVCRASSVDKEARKAERPSDHAPVWVDLDIEDVMLIR